MRNKKFKNVGSPGQLNHFKSLLNIHGFSHQAVSSESIAHKELRYKHISEIFAHENARFSIHEVGMGLGDFHNYLRNYHGDKNIIYSGSDIVPDFVDYCKKNISGSDFYLRDLSEIEVNEKYDYVIFNGVFHQMRNISRNDWEDFAYNILFNSFKLCKHGMAFNFISPFVDYYQENLYYCDLMKLLHVINEKMSRFFVIKHNYALYELTIFVYPPNIIKKQNKYKEMQKYF